MRQERKKIQMTGSIGDLMILSVMYVSYGRYLMSRQHALMKAYERRFPSEIALARSPSWNENTMIEKITAWI